MTADAAGHTTGRQLLIIYAFPSDDHLTGQNFAAAAAAATLSLTDRRESWFGSG